MPIFNECNIPEDLYYDIENQVWGRKNADGTFTFGMTDPAQSLAVRVGIYQGYFFDGVFVYSGYFT